MQMLSVGALRLFNGWLGQFSIVAHRLYYVYSSQTINVYHLHLRAVSWFSNMEETMQLCIFECSSIYTSGAYYNILGYEM